MNYPRIIAHRCGGTLAAENTLAGLVAAAGIGCRGVEFDVMLSADRVPVLMHDERLERTTDGRGLVAELPLAALRQVRVGGEPVPTLAEALATCGRLGLWANIEIKPNQWGPAVTAVAVGKVLADHWDGRGVVSSFAEEALETLAGEGEGWPRALLVKGLPSDWRERVARLGVAAVHCSAAHLNPDALAAIRGAGLSLAAYTVNDRTLADRWLAAGLSAVFTDRPEQWSIGEM